jgi:predicted small metal-binding protein
MEGSMGRKMADRRRFESDSDCTLTIIGDEDEVVRAAAEHAVAVHGHTDSAELREQIGAMLEDESRFVPGERAKEPFPA